MHLSILLVIVGRKLHLLSFILVPLTYNRPGTYFDNITKPSMYLLSFNLKNNACPSAFVYYFYQKKYNQQMFLKTMTVAINDK